MAKKTYQQAYEQTNAVVRANGIEDIDGPKLNGVLTTIIEASESATVDLQTKETEQDEQIALKANTSDVDAKNKEQDAEIAKKLNTADAVGKKTAEGGEIFNDYSQSAGNYGHTEGQGNVNTGVNSHVEGLVNTCSANLCHVSGQGNDARATYSTIGGLYNTTTSGNDGETAFGRYNKSNDGTLFSIGNGAGQSRRKNSYEIMTNDKHYINGIGGYDGTNPSTAKDVATFLNGGDVFMAYVAKYGMRYNTLTNRYEYRGFSLTTDEMLNCLPSIGWWYGNSHEARLFNYLGKVVFVPTMLYARTNTVLHNINRLARQSPLLEEFYVPFDSEYYSFAVSECFDAFQNCPNLKYIGILNMTESKEPTNAFQNCPALETLKLWGLKKNLAVKSSSLLSEESLLYIIDNERSTGTITITLEPSAYDRLNALTTVKNALAAHPNIKLAK